jgi:hypothetical protein
MPSSVHPVAQAPQTDLTDTPAATASAPTIAAMARSSRLIDSDATRQALRAIAGEKRWHDDNAASASAYRGPQQRLQQGIAHAARGDCLRGEFDGAGMGLLGTPLLALALLNDRCRR